MHRMCAGRGLLTKTGRRARGRVSRAARSEGRPVPLLSPLSPWPARAARPVFLNSIGAVGAVLHVPRLPTPAN